MEKWEGQAANSKSLKNSPYDKVETSEKKPGLDRMDGQEIAYFKERALARLAKSLAGSKESKVLVRVCPKKRWS